jgi:hypothetical protein
MSSYMVSYDLLNKRKFGDYKTLIAAIRRLGGTEILYSQWLLKSTRTSVQIRDSLTRFMHADDSIFVTEIPINWAGRNLMVNPNNL